MNTATPLQVDVAIIGTGTAGMRAYVNALKHTKRIALIEGNRYGTTCARVGCMPSKLMIAPAEARHRTETFEAFGLSTSEVKVNGVALMKRVKRERDRFVGFVENTVEGFNPEHRHFAMAEFLDNHTLQLSNGTVIHAERIVIATGSTPEIPEHFKPAGKYLATSDDVFYWDDLPESCAVIGTGIIGLELGQALHRLGVRVKLFARKPLVGTLTDETLREKATQYFENELPLYMNTHIDSIESTELGAKITYQSGSLPLETDTFDVVLVATGRKPNVDSLHLERTSLTLNDAGIPLYNNATLQCEGAPHIFIAGDVNDALPLLHVAGEEGLIAGANAGSYPSIEAHPRKTPLVIAFTDPQLAIAGQSLAEIKEQGIPYVIGEKSYDDQGRARVFQINRGHLRLYAHAETGRILGAEMVGPEMEHIAHLLAWSMGFGATVDELIAQPFYHPTIEEGLLDALRLAKRSLESKEMSPSV